MYVFHPSWTDSNAGPSRVLRRLPRGSVSIARLDPVGCAGFTQSGFPARRRAYCTVLGAGPIVCIARAYANSGSYGFPAGSPWNSLPYEGRPCCGSLFVFAPWSSGARLHGPAREEPNKFSYLEDTITIFRASNKTREAKQESHMQTTCEKALTVFDCVRQVFDVATIKKPRRCNVSVYYGSGHFFGALCPSLLVAANSVDSSTTNISHRSAHR